ncbi:predicted protein [Nematostella vectensis]|uniref:Uncharacterized protein n=1 Tax=Nematostella vectensis TaxID=45351 RepID=A7RSM5_NEMVE|nr:predicted protein [Nematostella vectensis]|eukprot:XP_001637657.1 predicted protein [Nematostella vectensis]
MRGSVAVLVLLAVFSNHELVSCRYVHYQKSHHSAANKRTFGQTFSDNFGPTKSNGATEGAGVALQARKPTEGAGAAVHAGPTEGTGVAVKGGHPVSNDQPVNDDASKTGMKQGSFKIDDGDVIGAGTYEMENDGTVDVDLKIRINPGSAKALCAAKCEGSTDEKKKEGGGGGEEGAKEGGESEGGDKGGAKEEAKTTPAPENSSTKPGAESGGETTPAPGATTPPSEETTPSAGGTTPAPGGSEESTTPASDAGAITPTPAAGAGQTTPAGAQSDALPLMKNKFHDILHNVPEMNRLNGLLSQAASTWAESLKNARRRTLETQRRLKPRDPLINRSYWFRNK